MFMNRDGKSRSEKFFSFIKNLFIVLLFLQFAPMVITGLKTTFEDLASPKVHVGYLAINGMIDNSTHYVKNIDKFLQDPDIKALLVKINSPGGFPGSAQAVFNELKRFKKSKPVVVLVENACASGAYYIAAGANTIIANPSSLVGSIGVLMQLPNVKELLESWKIHVQYVQSGTYKTAGSPVKALSPQEKEYLQQLSDDNYRQFIKDMAQARGLNLKDHKKWADGQIFTGTQALQLILIDKIGSFSDAREEIKKLAKVDEDIKLIAPKGQSGFLSMFASDDELGQDPMSWSDFISEVASKVYTKISMNQTASAVIS